MKKTGLRLLCCGSGGSTGCTGELHGANNSVLGVDKFESLEVEVANLKGLAQAEIIDIDNQTLGNFCVGCANLELFHRERKLTAGLNTLGVTLELNGNGDGYGLLGINFEKVDVEHIILYRMELDVFENSHALFAVYIELDCEYVGGIDELAYSLVCNCEIGGDKALIIADFNNFLTRLEGAFEREGEYFATVENNGNLGLSAESGCGFLSESSAGLGYKLKCLHVVINDCVTKN